MFNYDYLLNNNDYWPDNLYYNNLKLLYVYNYLLLLFIY